MRILNVSKIADPNWRWLEGKMPDSRKLDWAFISTNPRNFIERIIKKPQLGRLRGCREAGRILAKGQADVVVTHMPLWTAWTAFFCGSRRRSGFHLAFTFNFTSLPDRKRTRFMRRQFSLVDRFTVFSNFEKDLYSRVFGIPLGKIDMVRWSVETPTVPEEGAVIPGDYICSIGGEGRDYAPLAEAARHLPQIKFVVVARKKNLIGVDFPSNIIVFTDLPEEKTINILFHSLFSVVGLQSEETPCGHVTIVAAMHLGKAQVVTYSKGLTDYIIDGQNALFAKVGDAGSLKEKIETLLTDEPLRRRLGEGALAFAKEHCSEAIMVRYFQSVLDTI
jgi:glycosyltransferase involved in cell wall biosynthesis